MRCIHVQRNFGFAYSKEMIHQNCRWLWRRRKHRFSLCAWCPPVVFMFSYSGVNQTHQWQILVLCKRYRRVCLVFFCEYSAFWKAGIQFSMQPVGFGCANSEFPDLDWAHFSQSSHTGVPDSHLAPPRAVLDKRICAGVSAFCSDPVKMPPRIYWHF